jgi:hypothetical protein
LNYDLIGGALLGQISATWEEMKIVVFLWEAVANKVKNDARSREVTITAGAESVLLLLIVPGMDVLILQMDRERRKNLSSSEWKATANTAKKKTVTDTKTILWIREWRIMLLSPFCPHKPLHFYHLIQKTVKGYHL